MKPLPDHPIAPFPTQPEGMAWPTAAWPEALPAECGADPAVDGLLDELVSTEPHPVLGRTYAAAVIAGGQLVAERYGQRVVADLRAMGEDPPYDDLGPDDELLSWSMAKSITNLAVGIAVADGHLRVDDPVGDPIWLATPGDPRAAITWEDLLTMRAGLAWTEEYYDLDPDALPDVITMLYGDAANDMATFVVVLVTVVVVVRVW